MEFCKIQCAVSVEVMFCIIQNNIAAPQNLYLVLHFIVITDEPLELGICMEHFSDFKLQYGKDMKL
jgi:hypothetical protein